MSQYFKTVVSVVLAVSAMSFLFPKDSFGKYANLLSGLVVMAVILMPVIDMDEKIVTLENIEVRKLETDSNRYLMDEFEKELSQRICSKLKEETGIDFSVVVYAEEDGGTVEIQEVEINPYKETYARMVSDYLGIEEDKITSK